MYASRYQTTAVPGNKSTDKILECIAELKTSKTVLVSYRVSDPNAGMSNTIWKKSGDIFFLPFYMVPFCNRVGKRQFREGESANCNIIRCLPIFSFCALA